MPIGDELRGILELDRVLHEPARLLIIAILSTEKDAGFPDLLTVTRMSSGNLHSHLRRLEAAGYIEGHTTHRGKRAVKLWQLSEVGQAAFEIYQQQMKRVCHFLNNVTIS